MRLFFKHLFKSIAKRPLQPVIIVLVLCTSILMSLLSYGIENALSDEVQLAQAEKYGSADITITLNGTSSSRFVFAGDVDEALGEGVRSAGTYELPLFYTDAQRTVFGVAVDFSEIGNIFDLAFTEYGTVGEYNRADAALITKDFATRHGLVLGDRFSVKALGHEKIYTVEAISATPFISAYEVMVDISGVMRLLAADSVLVAALGEDFKPSSTLFVDVPDEVPVNDAAELLSAHPAFSGKTVSIVSDEVVENSNAETLSNVIDIAIILISVLAVSVTFCCLYILSAQRTEENAVFVAAGATPVLLYFAQYAEILIYFFVGATLGTLMALPFLKLFGAAVGLRFASATVSGDSLLKSWAIVLAVSLLTVTLLIAAEAAKRRGRRGNGMRGILLVMLPAISAVLFAVLVASPPASRFALYIPAALLLLATLFYILPYLLCKFVGFLGKRIDKKLREKGNLAHTGLYYAVKNLFSVRVLHNTARLVAVLTVLVGCMLVVITSTHGHVFVAENFFDGEYVVMNATERCYDKLLECPDAERIDKVFFGRGSTEDGTSLQLVSATDLEAFSELLDVDSLPKGNKAIISSGQARVLSLDVGETFIFNADGKLLELEVSDIAYSGIAFVVFDCEHFGIAHNMLLAKGKQGVSSDELLQSITSATSLELAAVSSTADVMEDKLSSVSVYLNAANFLLAVIIVFSIVGLVDNLVESYRARREEFYLYSCSGMARRTLRSVKISEVLLSLAFGVTLGAIGCAIVLLETKAGMLSFGYELFINFTNAF